jgi:hypothetical protein
MDVIINSVDDQTPKGLTTGFRVRLNCTSAQGKPFVLSAALLVSKDVLSRQIPLPNLVIAGLKKSGLEEYVNELFIDTRRLNLDAIPNSAPAFPQTVTLGGVELLNSKAVEKLTAKA